MKDFRLTELMACAAAREIKDKDVVMVGVGIPMVAAYLAQRTRAPNLIMVIELGIVGPRPDRLPGTIFDPALTKNAVYACSMVHTLGALLPYVNIGFLGAAQIDKFGNLNTTVVGDYYKPTVRLTASGGAADIGAIAEKYMIMMRHEKHRFVETVDYLTTVGFYKGGNSREELGLPGGGPVAVLTNLGVLRFDKETKEMYVESCHPGCTVEQIKENTGFDIKIAPDAKETTPPDEEELRILRAIDPKGIYLRE